MPIHIKRIKMSLREKLEKIREDLNLTVAEIARRLEISRAGWYKLLEVEEKEKDIKNKLRGNRQRNIFEDF